MKERLDSIQMFIINEIPLFYRLSIGYYHATKKAGNGMLFSIMNGIKLAIKAMRV